MISNERILNDITVLFLLKLHREHVTNDFYGYNVSCCREDYVCLMLFSIQYIKISGFNPTKILLTKTVYDWVQNQPEYLQNPDIKAEVDNIKILYEKRKNK